jgi:hypothetical protein
MTQDEILDMAKQVDREFCIDEESFNWIEAFAKLVAAKEREAIYQLVMEAPFKEFDRQEEDFDGEAAIAMKAMAFSLTSAIRARGEA